MDRQRKRKRQSHAPGPLTEPQTPEESLGALTEPQSTSGEPGSLPEALLAQETPAGEPQNLVLQHRPPLVVLGRVAARGGELLTQATQLLHQPCDPAALAATRIMFGALMVLDVPQERGMGMADLRWGDTEICHFPLFPALSPLPFPFMVLLYGVMALGAAGMAAGWRWRLSGGVFLISYWYLFLLDKVFWNNHSYLYGLLSAILLVSEPHRCWSVDAWRGRTRGGAARHVPFWNYLLLRAQVFLLYFLAGIKKIDADWLRGHSMRYLAEHWVFAPFRLTLSTASIDYYIVHIGGFVLDLTLGPILLWRPTRKFGLVFGACFHLMNSQIFLIGMFPWVCLATLPVFCSCSWPRHCLASLPSLPWPRRPPVRGAEGGDVETDRTGKETVDVEGDERDDSEEKEATQGSQGKDWPDEAALAKNPNCVYPGEVGVTAKQRMTAVLVACYLLLQLFLPFSHSLTKGFNTWTDGPYGYSWDMMVHSWSTLHVKVTAVTSHTGHRLYLDPDQWVLSPRWSGHADMAVQYGRCVQSRLAALGLPISALHLDVWKSLNGRFQQRMFDPTVNILEAPWSPWSETPWVLPVVSAAEHWRERLYLMEEELERSSSSTEQIFVADFPGLTLENYLSPDLEEVRLEVLQGRVLVLLPSGSDNGTLDGAAPPQGLQGDSGGVATEHRCDSKDIHTGPKNLTRFLQARKRDFQDLVKSSCDCHRPEDLQNMGAELTMQTSCVVLRTGGSILLPNGAFHSVTTTSLTPALYSYTFTNATLKTELESQESRAAEKRPGEVATSGTPGGGKPGPPGGYVEHAHQARGTRPHEATDSKTDKKPSSAQSEEAALTTDFPTFQDFVRFSEKKGRLFWRAGKLLVSALSCILTRSCMKIE